MPSKNLGPVLGGSRRVFLSLLPSFAPAALLHEAWAGRRLLSSFVPPSAAGMMWSIVVGFGPPQNPHTASGSASSFFLRRRYSGSLPATLDGDVLLMRCGVGWLVGVGTGTIPACSPGPARMRVVLWRWVLWVSGWGLVAL